MRNLKKMLAVLVAVAVMLTAMVPAFAAGLTDVKGTAYESAANRLNALGIITGRDGGVFAPNDTITRAEFAAVVVRALGYGDAAEAAKGVTKFSDVKADSWATGYINLASNLGIINGRPDGTFAPDAKVLYEEAVTMVVRALGYKPAAEANGGYPTGYMVIAAQEDITEDAAGAVGLPASRGLVAIMVDNSLEVKLMEQTGYGTETKFEKVNKTLLDNKLKLDVYKARVLSTGDKLEVKYVNMPDTTADDSKVGVREKLTVFETISQAGLEDALVTLWIKDGVVYDIKNDSSILYDVIAEVNGKDNAADLSDTLEGVDEIKLKIADNTYDVQEDTNSKATWTVDIDRVGQTLTAADSADDLLGKFAKVVVEDGKVTKVEAYTRKEGGIITAVDDKYIEFTQGNDEGKKIREIDGADSLLVVVNNKAVDYSELKADMYFDYYVDAGNDNFVIAATDAKKSGKLEKAKDDKIQIAGSYTDLNANYYISDNNGDDYTAKTTSNTDVFADYLGSDVVAYVNLDNKIAYVKGDVKETTSTFYGFLVNAESFDKKIRVAREVDGDMKEVTYESDLGSTGMTFTAIESADLDGDAKSASPAERIAAFAKFTIDENNVITKVESKAGVTQLINADFNKDSDLIDAATDLYMDDQLIFVVTNNAGPNYNDIEVYKWSEIKATDTPSAGLTAYYDGDETPDVVVLDDTTDAISFGTTDEFLGFVTEKVKVSSEDYEYTIATVTADGKKTFTVDKDDIVAGSAANHFVVYKPTSTTDKVEIVATAAYDNLAAINAYDSDYTAVGSGTLVSIAEDSIDGRTFKVGTTMYRLASNAVVIEKDGGDYYERSLSDIDDEDSAASERATISFIVKDGLVRVLVFDNP